MVCEISLVQLPAVTVMNSCGGVKTIGIMGIEQRQLLAAVDGIVGIADKEDDAIRILSNS